MHTEAHNMQANYYYSTICNNMYGIIGTFDRVYEHYICLLLYTELSCFVLAHIFVPTTETPYIAVYIIYSVHWLQTGADYYKLMRRDTYRPYTINDRVFYLFGHLLHPILVFTK